MSLANHNGPRHVLFVSRNPTGENMRSARAIRQLEGVRLFGISETLPDDQDADLFTELVQVSDSHDVDQLIAAGRGLVERHGSLDQIVTTTETLLKPAARTGEVLGLQGMSVSTVRRVLDKSCLKQILEGAGIDTARDQVLTSKGDADSFIAKLGFPVVLKPLNGSGGLATWCIRNGEQLELALELMEPSATNAVLAEEYLHGREMCIDTIAIENEPRFYSICYYRSPILEALEDERIQWSCVMPRDTGAEEYRELIKQGLAAVRALSVGNAMTHMEGFLDAGRVRFTDATLRPAGARIAPMLAYAYDLDPYLAWARVAVDGCFDGPWKRDYAVGTIFLRGPGQGQIVRVDGIESVRDQLGELLVDSRLPRVGAAKSGTYTGDGYITVRHAKTEAVEQALDFIAQGIKITYSHLGPAVASGRATTERWGERLGYFSRQLNRPAWDR